MSFLPDGLELEEASDVVESVPIVQADEAGPVFTVQVKILPLKEYRAIFNKLNTANVGGTRQSQQLQDKVDRDYLTRVIAGWSGLTLDNWEAIVRDGKKFTGPKADKMRKDNEELSFTTERAFYLYRNTWPQVFGNPIFDKLQEGATQAEAEESNVKS